MSMRTTTCVDAITLRCLEPRLPGQRAASANTFPPLTVDPGIVGGRCPLHGYQRGWGLQFGTLGNTIRRDRLYRCARAAGRGSLLTEACLQNLFLVITQFFEGLPDHNIIEFGSYRGGTAIFMAYLLRELYPKAQLISLDTFSGVPDSEGTIDHHRVGDFSDAHLQEFLKARDRLRLENLIIHPGAFEDTVPAVLSGNRRFALAHIDCDTRSAVAYAEQQIWPHMITGGYVIFDDANVSSCLGATEAVESMICRRQQHCEQAWPHLVFRSGLEQHQSGNNAQMLILDGK